MKTIVTILLIPFIVIGFIGGLILHAIGAGAAHAPWWYRGL